jgi:para-aminobenzoate synthetase/4-amino-4-deoxychorismate lyase
MQLFSEDQPRPWTPLPLSWRKSALANQGSVLLESSLASHTEHRSYLFLGAQRVLTARRSSEIPALFQQIEKALADGLWVAGYLGYEAGLHLQQLPSSATEEPLAAFGIFNEPRTFDHLTDSTAIANSPEPAFLPVAPMLRIRRAAYTAAIARIHEWIASGETYQLNFTTSAISPYDGDALALYDALQAQQPCSYGATLNLLPTQTIVSLSPELFFRATSDGLLTTKPMKGTAVRGASQAEDDSRAEALRSDEKNRAEHVMIVDLLRNDLGRICKSGSVRVERLFDVERYPTLLQMTSTITGHLSYRLPWYEIFRALFPSGSITGAPKRHTMELIAKVEDHPRGVYTGAVGFFAPDGSACFNVAIRTVVLNGATMEAGVGGGIVADSTAENEYDECLLKTAFLQRAARPFQLIETLLAKNGSVPLLDRHLQRMAASAQELGFVFSEQQVRTLLRQSVESTTKAERLRLVLHRDGVCQVEMTEAPTWAAELHIHLKQERLQSGAPHLRHKTTFRPEYSPGLQAAQAQGFDEAVFQNEDGEMVDGCISSLLVFVDDEWYTPRWQSGCLPGVYRSVLVDAGLVQERLITVENLRSAESLALCNAVRGVGMVSTLQLPHGERIRYKVARNLPQVPA